MFGNPNETFKWKYILIFLLIIKSFNLLLKQLEGLSLFVEHEKHLKTQHESILTFFTLSYTMKAVIQHMS